MTKREVTLREWSTVAAGTVAGAALNGLFLDDAEVRRVAELLRSGQVLDVRENRHGLVLSARQHVGVVMLGEVRVAITLKLPPDALWSSLAYGLGGAADRRMPSVSLSMSGAFPDLLAALMPRARAAHHPCGPSRGLARAG